MTYVVRDRNLILGTTQSLDGTMQLAKPYFENFCEARGIPTGSGGIPFVDIREGVIDYRYIRWEYSTGRFFQDGREYSNTATWRLVFPGLGPEFRDLNLTIDRFKDVESKYRLNYFRRADMHVNMRTGKTDCKVCGELSRLHGYLDILKWPDDYTVHQVFFWRVYQSCFEFRKQYADFGDPHELIF